MFIGKEMKLSFFKNAPLLLSIMLFSGCTTNSWINAVGSVLEGKDKYEKDSRSKRIKAANKAAGY
ncbi:hypothetical protein [Enterobacter asburiae]|uniref:Lipoprotein n=1 Tax=Enterobacter asburiae TaxID=61645 RepID=A0A8I1KGL1_ENTAS|nr:hypothetical protein [Enterobacter asburiae]EMB6149893.1 hypothetical protein [Enterobacter asburiae]MBJ6597704.1 hypothetical protein [Enterobacter asburiae]MBK4464722.1 hypothetical protein [Enterobacter asburiae]MBK4571998.1 hypothetical protein [Enterobacter asburiae]MCQ4367716.1 hypothetical protein [Enterobacter asburiae]